VAGAGGGVHDDPPVALEPDLLRELGAGDRADTDQDEVGGQHPPVRELHGLDSALGARADRHDLGGQQHAGAAALVGATEELRDDRGHRPPDQSLRRLDDRDLLALGPGGRGGLEADEAAADHHHPRGVGELPSQPDRVVELPQ
jgi:hypothetical protein